VRALKATSAGVAALLLAATVPATTVGASTPPGRHPLASAVAGSKPQRIGLLASARVAPRQVTVPRGRYGAHVVWGGRSGSVPAAHRGAPASPTLPWPPPNDSPPSYLISPPDGATIATTTPALAAFSILDPGTSDYQGYPCAYDFKVMTAPGGGETVADSGWLYDPFAPANITNWAIPTGALRDGETYYVSVQTDDSELLLTPLPATTITSFTVHLREGAGGPSPSDTVGSTPSGATTPANGAPSPGRAPASETVNLVTGNLSLAATTQTLQAVGGAAAVQLNYNSLNANLYGLAAMYFVDTGDHSFSGADTLIGRRTDPMLDFNWALPPIGALPLTGSTGFLVKWTGTIYMPLGSPTTSAGNWQFGVQAGGGMRVCIDQTGSCGDSNAAVASWSQGASASSPVFGATLNNVVPGPHAITVEAWVPTGPSVPTVLWAQNATPSAPNPSPFIVPSSWLSSTPASLPAGWSLSGQAYNSAWTGLVDEGSQVVVTAAAGSTADFLGTGAGQAETFRPPAGDTDLLTRNADGTLTLTTRAGDVYTFTSNGLVSSITTAENATAIAGTTPAALHYTYSGDPLQLTAITDPVSGRSISLNYNGNGSCPASSSTGVALNPPVDMLCAISYWDGTQSTFAYNPQGELAQVDNPGGVSQFGYDSAGRLGDVRDPLAFAAIQAGQRSDCPASAPGTPTCDTTIAYLISGSTCAASFTPNCAQVASVTQPAATVGAAQPARSYCYGDSPATSTCTPTASTTTVSVAGFSPAGGFNTKVVYNSSSEIVSRTGPTGATTTAVWDAAGRPVVSIAPTGLQTTTMYDNASHPTDSYGPAPAGCFSTTAPYLPLANLSGCGVSVVPHTLRGYDEGIVGPNTSIWSNSTASGPPCQETTGLGSDSAVTHVWGTTVPTCASSSGAWSMQMTGIINLPSAGTWTFQLASQSNLALTIDGGYLGSAVGTGTWGQTLTTTLNVAAPGWHQIQIGYTPLVNPTSTQSNGFIVSYQPPGGTMTTVPYTALDPGYGLKTSTVDPDGKVTIVRYIDAAGGIDPIDGLATQTIQDPSTATVAADGMPAALADPSGLSLITTTRYETPGPGTYFRRISTTLPASNRTAYTYYPGTAGPLAAVCGDTSTTPQGGLLKQQTDPAVSGVSRIQQFVYNAAGRQVGVRVGSTATMKTALWQCTSYDTSGRMTGQTWPASSAWSARTVTYTYSVGGNPLATTVADSGTTGTIANPASSVTSTVDLLGRVVSYTDAGNQTTTTSYSQNGQVASTSGLPGLIATSYDPNSGQATTTMLNGVTLATSHYDIAGRLSTVTYANGTTASIGYDNYGNQTGLNYTITASGALLDGDQVTKSAGGRTTTELQDVGGTSLVNPNPAGATAVDYTYDGAARLTLAYLPDSVVTYGYGRNPVMDGCTQPGAGANTNRTSVASLAGGVTKTVDYCYNTADQLTSTIVNGGTKDTNFGYDTVGNQNNDNSTTLVWDTSNRLASTTNPAGTATTYSYDALDRIMKQVDGATTTRYSYSGMTTTPAAVVSQKGSLVNAFVALAGGVLVTVPGAGLPSSKWSLSNLQGGVTLAVTDTGTPNGAPIVYDPWGVQVTGTKPVANTPAGSADFGAYGADGKLTDPGNGFVTMGARPFNPGEARFLTVDPINGGCANAYTYSFGDPLNHPDLTGQSGCAGGQNANGGEINCGYISCTLYLFPGVVAAIAKALAESKDSIANIVGAVIAAAIVAALAAETGPVFSGFIAALLGEGARLLTQMIVQQGVDALQRAADRGDALEVGVGLDGGAWAGYVRSVPCNPNVARWT
jgi:RHS repeat-associated protein